MAIHRSYQSTNAKENRMLKSRFFTLIELLVVIAIIAIILTSKS